MLGENAGFCEVVVTFETANGNITRTLTRPVVTPSVNQIATLVGKEATKVTVEATTFPDSDTCAVNIFGTKRN